MGIPDKRSESEDGLYYEHHAIANEITTENSAKAGSTKKIVVKVDVSDCSCCFLSRNLF